MRTLAFAVVASAAGTPAPNRKILSSGTATPLIGKIEGFTFPRMGGTEGDQVTFGDYSEVGNEVSVYDSLGKGFLAGINSTTVDEQGQAFLGFGDFALSSSNHPVQGAPVTVFISSVSGADGVFVRLPDGNIVTVVTTTTKSPSGSAYNFLSQPTVEVSEDKSTLLVAFEARAGTVWRGIVLAKIPVDYTGADSIVYETVADTSTMIPNADVKYKCLSAPAVTRQGEVIFFGSHCGSNTASAMVQNQWSNLAIYEDVPVTQHSLTAHRGVSVGVGVVSPGVWRWTKGALSVVADDQIDIPGGSSGERFQAFSNPGVGVDGTTVFVALGNDASYGIFKQRPGQPLERVVGRQDEVPGYAGCNFANFPQTPSVGEKGDVVFFGACSAEVAGVFYEAGSKLGTIVNYDDKVDGQGLVYVGYGTNAYSADKVAMYILLENNLNGVWTFDVPSGTALQV